jgi:hypothetical protein
MRLRTVSFLGDAAVPFLKEIDVLIEFVRDGASGKIIGFAMTQDGSTKNVIRD